MSFPVTRMRRLRRTETLRGMVRENRLAREDLILPLFVVEGSGIREAIDSMPGVYRHSVDQVVLEAKRVVDLGDVYLWVVAPGDRDRGVYFAHRLGEAVRAAAGVAAHDTDVAGDRRERYRGAVELLAEAGAPRCPAGHQRGGRGPAVVAGELYDIFEGDTCNRLCPGGVFGYAVKVARYILLKLLKAQGVAVN